MSDEDWMALLDYADIQFFGKASGRDFFRLPFASEVESAYVNAGEHKVAFSMEREDLPRMNYLLNLPEGYSETGEPWPLILFLQLQKPQIG